jgi:hypothetical protein
VELGESIVPRYNRLVSQLDFCGLELMHALQAERHARPRRGDEQNGTDSEDERFGHEFSPTKTSVPSE